MKETELPCGTRVTAEIMKGDGACIGVDIQIHLEEENQPSIGFFIEGSSMVEAVKFLRETAEDYWEEETSCTSTRGF